MARASATPKGASTPAGSPANREKQAVAERLRTGHFLKHVERLIAFGFKPESTGTVKVVPTYTEHFHRDLPRASTVPASPYHRHGAEGVRAAGRRPTTLTPEQAEALDAKRQATAASSSAFA